MAAEDDLVTRLMFETFGQEAIDATTIALAKNEGAIKTVQAAMVSTDAPIAAYEARLRELVKTNTQLTQELERLRVAESAHARAMLEEATAAQQDAVAMQALATSTAQVHTGMSGVATGSSKAAQTLLQLGYAADDAQYGFRGIANNIPMIALAIGGPHAMAIAGASAIAATAINQIIIHWSDLTDLFGMSKTETEAERMDRLASSTHRTAEETKELNKHKREEAEIESLAALKSQAAQEAQKVFREAIGEIGFEPLKKGLAESRIAAQGGWEAMMSEAAQKEIGAYRKGAMELGYDPAQMQAAIDRVKAAERLRIIGEMTAGAEKDIAAAGRGEPGQLKGLLGEIQKRPGFFPGGTGEAIAAATPEGIQAEAEDEARAERDKENLDQFRKARTAKQKREREAGREAEALNRRGEQNETAAVRQREQEARKQAEDDKHDVEVLKRANQQIEASMKRMAAIGKRGATAVPKAEQAEMEQQIAGFIQQNAVTPQGGAYTPQQAMIAAKKAMTLMARDNLNAMQAAQVAVMQLNTELQQIAHQVNGIGNNFRRVHQASRMRMGNRNPF